MSVVVHLVRHCPQPGVRDVLCGRLLDDPLSDEGRDRAARLADGLAATAPARIDSSPRKRATETAAMIGAAADTPIAVAVALDEIDFGDWSGRSFADLDKDVRWRFWNAARDRARPPGGETMHDAVDRAAHHLGTMEKETGDGATVICVTHGDIIRGLVARFVGLGLDRILAMEVDPGSVTTLVVEGDDGRLVALNRCYP